MNHNAGHCIDLKDLWKANTSEVAVCPTIAVFLTRTIVEIIKKCTVSSFPTLVVILFCLTGFQLNVKTWLITGQKA